MNIPTTSELSREDVNLLTGTVMLEFGAEWCGYCQAAQSITPYKLALHPNARHIKIEDVKDRALGRTFTVKLWRIFNNEEIRSALVLISTKFIIGNIC